MPFIREYLNLRCKKSKSKSEVYTRQAFIKKKLRQSYYFKQKTF